MSKVLLQAFLEYWKGEVKISLLGHFLSGGEERTLISCNLLGYKGRPHNSTQYLDFDERF